MQKQKQSKNRKVEQVDRIFFKLQSPLSSKYNQGKRRKINLQKEKEEKKTSADLEFKNNENQVNLLKLSPNKYSVTKQVHGRK